MTQKQLKTLGHHHKVTSIAQLPRIVTPEQIIATVPDKVRKDMERKALAQEVRRDKRDGAVL